VDARDKRGHDESSWKAFGITRHAPPVSRRRRHPPEKIRAPGRIGGRPRSRLEQSYGFRPTGPENRMPFAEKSSSVQGFFGETVSGIPKGSTGNRIRLFL
jgi:hypothetical protein